MSVKIMSRVWENAPYEGGTLLVLLALADWSDDEGWSWPSVEKLSRKARLKDRQTRTIIHQLERDGALEIVQGGGRSRQNRYRITLQKLQGLESSETLQSVAQTLQSTTETLRPTATDPLVVSVSSIRQSSFPARVATQPKPETEIGIPPNFSTTRSATIAGRAKRSKRMSRAAAPPRMIDLPLEWDLTAWHYEFVEERFPSLLDEMANKGAKYKEHALLNNKKVQSNFIDSGWVKYLQGAIVFERNRNPSYNAGKKPPKWAKTTINGKDLTKDGYHWIDDNRATRYPNGIPGEQQNIAA